MCVSDWCQIATAVGTAILAGVTWWLVKVTKDQLSKQNKITKDNLAASLQLKFEDKFDSLYMLQERVKLANQIKAKAAHNKIQEPVMNFFESVGVMVRRGYLDKELAWASFGFYCFHWWCITKDYIFKERNRKNHDNTIFKEFEQLVDALYEVEIEHRKLTHAQLEPSTEQINQFLDDESVLLDEP